MEARNQLQRNRTSEHRATLSLSGVHRHHFWKLDALTTLEVKQKVGLMNPNFKCRFYQIILFLLTNPEGKDAAPKRKG